MCGGWIFLRLNQGTLNESNVGCNPKDKFQQQGETSDSISDLQEGEK